MRLLVLMICAGLTAGPAAAADLVIVMKTGAGKPVADAVVTVESTHAHPRPAQFAQPLRLAQHNKQFDPFVLVVPTGAEVSFPNQDDLRHQVYSFSPAKQFELKLYAKGQVRTVKFDKPGVVSVGCNIHDSMIAYVKVTDAPFAAKTDASGRAVLRDLPGGAAALVRVWHPYLKTPANEMRLDLILPAQGSEERHIVGDLRTPPMRMSGY